MGKMLPVGLVLVVLLGIGAGTVLATNVMTCKSPERGPCRGTNRVDAITGTKGSDRIYGRDSRMPVPSRPH